VETLTEKGKVLRMIKAVKWFGIGLLVIGVAVGGYMFSMQFADGPSGLVRGGPFQTGELAEAPDDWSFLKGRMEIEFQTLTPDTSRVVWLGVHDKRLYVVSGYMNTTFGKLWKHWPHRLIEDDRIILRIDGKLYEQRLERLMEHPQLTELMTIYAEKYGAGLVSAGPGQLQAALTNGDFWLFEVVDR